LKSVGINLPIHESLQRSCDIIVTVLVKPL